MSIASLHLQSELSLATYGLGLAVGSLTNLSQQEKLIDAGMSKSQAMQFADAGWSVVSQFTHSLSGASATVFADAAGRRFLAIRGTEPTLQDFLTDGILALGVPASFNPQFMVLREQVQTWLADGTLPSDETFTITGHSLGGYLATALKDEFSQHISDAYIYNAPGVGGIFADMGDFFQAAIGRPAPGASGIWNVQASEGFSVTAGLGYQLSEPILVQMEAASSPDGNHSMYRLSDALAVHALYAKLLPSVSVSELNQLADAAGLNLGDAPDAALDALRRTILGASAARTGDDREKLYEHLTALENDARFQALMGNPAVGLVNLTGLTAEDLVYRAAQGTTEGAAVRRALQALSPVALTGLEADKLGDHPYGYWQDRAAMLERLTWFNLREKQAYDPTYTIPEDVAPGTEPPHLFELESALYKDATTGLVVQKGALFASTRHYFFGRDDVSNTYTGAGVTDHLYGGSRADVLNGGGGADYLYGGAGGDVLNGGGGSDTLVGGKGRDWLGYSAVGRGNESLDEIGGEGNTYEGGLDDDEISGSAGNDTYIFRRGDGHDVIQTQGGSDELRLMAGGTPESGPEIAEQDVAFRRDGRDLLVVVGAGADSVTILGWFDPRNGTGKRLDRVTLGGKVWTEPEITALAEAATPVAEVIGTEGADTLYGLSNVSSVVSGLGGADTLYGSRKTDYLFGDDGNDRLFGGEGNDVLDGGAGDDILNGEHGDDVLNGGDGNDTLNGGMGTDILRGGTGDDILGTRAKEDTGFYSNGTYYSPGGGNIYEGGPGRDTLNGTSLADLYLFNLGDGHDTIREVAVQGQPVGEVDILRFGEDILPSDIRVERSGTNLVFRHANGTDSVTVAGWFENSIVGPNALRVERVEFADGTVWHADDLTAQALVMEGTDAGDSLTGLADCVNTLYGRGGADTLKGGNLADELYGGTGNDSLLGGMGHDIYHYLYGDGHDTVTDTGGEDTLLFHEIESNVAQFIRQGNDLVVDVGGVSPGSVTVKNHFYNTAYQVENFSFADRTYTAADVFTLLKV